MFELKKSEFGHRMTPGRLFEDFQLHATGGDPEAVRGSFVAVKDPNGTCIGAKESPCDEDSGTVIRSAVG